MRAATSRAQGLPVATRAEAAIGVAMSPRPAARHSRLLRRRPSRRMRTTPLNMSRNGMRAMSRKKAALLSPTGSLRAGMREARWSSALAVAPTRSRNRSPLRSRRLSRRRESLRSPHHSARAATSTSGAGRNQGVLMGVGSSRGAGGWVCPGCGEGGAFPAWRGTVDAYVAALIIELGPSGAASRSYEQVRRRRPVGVSVVGTIRGRRPSTLRTTARAPAPPPGVRWPDRLCERLTPRSNARVCLGECGRNRSGPGRCPSGAPATSRQGLSADVSGSPPSR